MAQIIDLKIPNVGDSDEIELVRWLKQENESFQEGEEICDLVTDKAAFGLEAPQAGKITKIIVGDCQKVQVGEIVAQIEID